jgi:hypothetical protein
LDKLKWGWNPKNQTAKRMPRNCKPKLTVSVQKKVRLKPSMGTEIPAFITHSSVTEIIDFGLHFSWSWYANQNYYFWSSWYSVGGWSATRPQMICHTSAEDLPLIRFSTHFSTPRFRTHLFLYRNVKFWFTISGIRFAIWFLGFQPHFSLSLGAKKPVYWTSKNTCLFGWILVEGGVGGQRSNQCRIPEKYF